jgi:hypothetical protein
VRWFVCRAPSLDASAFLAHDDFQAFGERVGIRPQRVVRALVAMTTAAADIEPFVNQSFLSDGAKAAYLAVVDDRRKRLAYRFQS